jgi:2'-5' RNA ligase
MQYAVVVFPEIPTNDIDLVRRQFDPQHSTITPHITLVFPTSPTAGLQQLTEHVQQVVAPWNPFAIRLHGLRRESSHWLVLDVSEGADQIRALHDALYTGPFADSLRRDIPYLPHLTLGVFGPAASPNEAAAAEARWEEAWTAAAQVSLDFTCTIRRICLLAISETRDITTVSEFPFMGSSSP